MGTFLEEGTKTRVTMKLESHKPKLESHKPELESRKLDQIFGQVLESNTYSVWPRLSSSATRVTF